MINNYDYYGPYVNLVKEDKFKIDVNTITIDTWDTHFNSILNILKDGIELEELHAKFITVDFGNNMEADLTITDYFFNVIMWYLIIRSGHTIEPKHIFFEEAITKSAIKKYIDRHFIETNRTEFDNMTLNNIIDDALYEFSEIDQFSMFLANTINLEDTIDLMNKSKEFNEIIHADLSNVPIEDVKNVGMKYTNKAIDIMKNSRDILGYDHCLADSWRAGEGINPRQYKEFSINIGSKPDGRGGVFPEIINSSFITGGVDSIESAFIDSSTGRTAQILSKMNVGTSGHFARLLGLNSATSSLHVDPNYICDTKNFQEIEIKNEKILSSLNNRYYRLHPDGMEYCIIDRRCKNLIGKKIYLRSPMTCASNSRGQGICYRCYGNLAYTVRDINIGRIASELLSSKLTQILLSAKHLLETVIKKFQWSPKFEEIFEIEGNAIMLQENNFKGYKMLIDPDDISLENEDDYKKNDYDDDRDSTSSYNEYMSEIEIVDDKGESFKIYTEDYDKLYISNELNTFIRKKGIPVDGKVQLELNDLKEEHLFYIILHNNELSKTMDRLKDIINKNDITRSMNRHQILQAMNEIVIEGNLNVNSVHLEVILSNQIRSVDNELEIPEWQYPNEEYVIMTLNQALTKNPSVAISLSYQKVPKALYNPLTYRKNAPSFMDLFFMEKPQMYLNSKDNIRPAKKPTDVEEELIRPYSPIVEEID